MSESEKHPDSDALETDLPSDALTSTVDLDELGDLVDLSPSFNTTPRIKDFLTSDDAPSRYLMILSFLFAGLAVLCFGLLIFQYVKHRHSGQKSAIVSTLHPAVASVSTKLGQFQVNWADGELHADLVVECENESTCEELKSRNPEARDSTLLVLQSSSRAEILDPVKKTFLRQRIVEALNKLKFSGKILEADFTDLLVEAPR